MKYKTLILPYLIAAGLVFASAESLFNNIPLPYKESHNTRIADNFDQCWCPCQCPTPQPTPPTPTPTPPIPPTLLPPSAPPKPQPHPPICNKLNPSFAVSLATSCYNCLDPDCSKSPNGSTFPYANHCQFYWMCENGMPTICYCLNGFWYDRDRHVCDYCPNVKNCPANAD